ncbi:hypothetical protein [Actinomadura viridis]|uniref:Uncharacterized protein n=1 Tax=Actinomadura viridis TaxID=58110 RepID=A0A931GQS6_9ACTN|nr:hypothetical protein [Actinomadura viridis]MBG6088879.1 hypothetical protein [Actinomadura viridis]
MTEREKDTEILVLRHQIVVLERQLAGERVRVTAADRALLVALLHRGCLPARCGGCGCWCGRTPYCAGTGT